MAEKKFRIGVSSRFLNPPSNNVFSLPQKLANVITWGVNYTQLDIQSTSEINRQDFYQGAKHILDSLKMRYGMHAEINEYVGLDWAVTQLWDPCHMKLNEYLDLLYDFFYDPTNPPEEGKPMSGWRKYVPEYLDFHVTQAMAMPPRSTQSELISAPCNTPWGEGNWKEFFNDNKHLKKWFMLNILKLLYERQAGVHQAYEVAKREWKAAYSGESGRQDIIKALTNTPDEEEFEQRQINELEEATNRLEREITGIRNDDTLEEAVRNRAIRMREQQIERATNEIETLRNAMNERKEKKAEAEKALKYLEGKLEERGRTRDAIKDFDEKMEIDEEFRDILFNPTQNKNGDPTGFLDFLYGEWLTASRKQNYEGSIVGEQYAYAIIAKYLEFKHLVKKGKIPDNQMDDRKRYDIFWDNFILHHYDGSDPVMKNWVERDASDVYNEMKIREKSGRERLLKMVEPDGTINLHSDIVAMVASCYIISHFETPMNQTEQYHEYTDYLRRKGITYKPEFHEMSPIEKLNELKITIVFENPHVLGNLRIPGTQRIIKGIDMEKLARTCEGFFNDRQGTITKRKIKNHLSLLLDFGWWQANGLDPVEQVKNTSKEFGEYVSAIQVHYAYAGGSHFTIDIGSRVHERMYEWLWILHKKGMIDVPIVFEGGGGQSPLEVVRTSIFAMRSIVKELEKEKPADPSDPKSLPPEFFGFNTDNLFSTERQLVTIKEHAFDPIKGMLEVKEFEHTFLGGHTLGKGKRPEEYQKERYK